MTKANLLIIKKNAFVDAESKFKSTYFKIDNTFQKQLIQYLVENDIRIVNTEKLN